jgi:hypothetical protein
MKTNEFITALREAPQNELRFPNVTGAEVRAGYHLTEIKAAHFDTVDCGGETNRWNETIVQLWVPEDDDDEFMTAGKFLSIFDKVTVRIPIDQSAEVRIEYGDEALFPSLYHVGEIVRENGATRVLLVAPRTTCKARDRRAGDVDLSACCPPFEVGCC